MISSRTRFAAGVVMVVAFGLVVPQSQATFPGDNGLITWTQAGDLWKALPNGSSPAMFVDDGDHAAWSVDGTSVVFDRQLNGGGEIFKAFADGSSITNLSLNAADDRQPTWSPDNQRVAFSSDRVGSEFRLYVMNADGSGVAPLTNGDALGAGTDDSAPEWSPNGQRIVFQRGDGAGGSDIYSMKADGTNVIALTGSTSPDSLPYDKLVTPKYSPNGSRIVFTAEAAACDSRIFTMDAATGANLALVNKVGGCLVAEPTWSPDGALILFRATGVPVSGDGLYGYRGANNTFSKLISGSGATSPDWQPVGGSPVTTSTSTSISSTTSSTTTSSTTTTTIVTPVDKKARPLIVRNGTWYERNTQSTGGADKVFVYGNPSGDVPVTGDWEGNGSVTPGVVRSGTWFLRNSNSAGVADVSFAYGNAGDVPTTGDWDGNGTVTPGVVRNGIWYLRNSNSTGVADVTFAFGNPGDIPVTGDWDSTNTFTAGVVRDGTWYLRNSNTSGVADVTFGYGSPGDIPLAGDWDGNNSSTPGVVRGGTWYLRNSNTTGVADVTFGYGDPGDKPLRWRSA